jgi:hypothetical protein
MGVEAFGIYRSPNSLSVLLDILRGADPPLYLRDEVVLAMASILDVEGQFYPLLIRFLEDPSLVDTLAVDEVEKAVEYYHTGLGGRFLRKKAGLSAVDKQAKSLAPAVQSYIKDRQGGSLSRWILELPDEFCQTIVQVILSEAVLDDELASYDRLRLLIVHWAARELKMWTQKLKQ